PSGRLQLCAHTCRHGCGNRHSEVHLQAHRQPGPYKGNEDGRVKYCVLERQVVFNGLALDVPASTRTALQNYRAEHVCGRLYSGPLASVSDDAHCCGATNRQTSFSNVVLAAAKVCH